MTNIKLRPREQEVFALIGSGLDYKAIAEKLGIARTTAAQHIIMIKARLAIVTGKQQWSMQEIAEFVRSNT